MLVFSRKLEIVKWGCSSKCVVKVLSAYWRLLVAFQPVSIKFCSLNLHLHLPSQLSQTFTRAAQKVMPHIFILGNYLFRMYAIHAQYNWMFLLHMLFFHIISIYICGLMPAWNKGMRAFAIPARFLFTWLFSHCTNNALVIFKPCPTQCILQWPKKMKIWRWQIRTMGGTGEHISTKFGDCLLGS
jgi:hypothetical protein